MTFEIGSITGTIVQAPPYPQGGNHSAADRRQSAVMGKSVRSSASSANTARIIARNLEFLVSSANMEWQTLALRSGVSLRAIGYIRKGERSPSIESVDALAQVFGLTGWHLLSPTLAADIENREWLDRIRASFNLTSPQGQELLKQAAQAAEQLRIVKEK